MENGGGRSDGVVLPDVRSISDRTVGRFHLHIAKERQYQCRKLSNETRSYRGKVHEIGLVYLRV